MHEFWHTKGAYASYIFHVIGPLKALYSCDNACAWLQSTSKMANHAKNEPMSHQVLDEGALKQSAIGNLCSFQG